MQIRLGTAEGREDRREDVAFDQAMGKKGKKKNAAAEPEVEIDPDLKDQTVFLFLSFLCFLLLEKTFLLLVSFIPFFLYFFPSDLGLTFQELTIPNVRDRIDALQYRLSKAWQ